jgi:hypothetical protein
MSSSEKQVDGRDMVRFPFHRRYACIPPAGGISRARRKGFFKPIYYQGVEK